MSEGKEGLSEVRKWLELDQGPFPDVVNAFGFYHE